MTKRYALVSVLAPLPDGRNEIPAEWIKGIPSSALFAADKLYGGQNMVADIGFNLRNAAFAFERSIAEDGWPG